MSWLKSETPGRSVLVDEPSDAVGDRRGETQIPRWIPIAGYCAFAVQLIVLILFDHLSVVRWNTTSDLGGYAQAWALIAHGHLNPYSSIFGYPFWRSHFELGMWPLSVLYWLHHSPETLKWLQSVAIVGAEVVGFSWVLSVVRRHNPPGIPATVAAVGYVLLAVANPAFYEGNWFDFHMDLLAIPFVLLAARALYLGRVRMPLIWSAAALLCGNVAGLYVAGLGVAALLISRKTRLTGGLLLVGGVLWVVIIGALGADKGSALDTYRYLASGGESGIIALLVGIITHPHTPIHVLRTRVHLILHDLGGGGVIGALAPWTGALIAAAVLPAALSSNAGYLTSPFQYQLATIALPVGAVLVVEWLSRRQIPRSRVAAGLVGAAVLVASMVYSLPRLHGTVTRWYVTSSAQVKVLDRIRAQLGPGTSLIVSENAIGGFAYWPKVLEWGWAPVTVVARPRQKFEFVVVDNRLAVFTQTQSRELGRYLTRSFGATETVSTSGVHVYGWRESSASSSSIALEVPGPSDIPMNQ